jgi:hypothetical protein
MKFTPLFLFVFALPCLAADQPPTQIDIQKLPSQTRMINRVIVPVPHEIFAVLDKIGHPNWKNELNKNVSKARPGGESASVALALGTIIGEGFIAVEAEDEATVKDLGRSILTFSEALGVRKAVVRRANSIIEFADKKDWSRVRRELDGALTDVKEAMAEINSESLSHLVSVGGWLRGTDALASVVSDNYSPQGADLLYQPGLLDYIDRELAGLKPRLRDIPVVARVRSGLDEIRPLILQGGSERLSRKKVKEVAAITSELVKTIQDTAR